MRKIPATMATQHPDNAHAPYWESDGDGFVSVQEEVRECKSAYADLGCEEYMWDWEGKYVDEAVIEKLFSSYASFFAGRQLGRDVFLTFRLPNIWKEPGYSLARALMGILTSEEVAHDLGFHTPPIFEVILPMTTSADQLITIQKNFLELARFKSRTFGGRHKHFEHIEIIPIFEDVQDLMRSPHILKNYIDLHKKLYRKKPDYIRPFIARSDPALNAGLVPAVLAAKLALSLFAKFSQEHHIPLYPIIGTGSLPFRGSLTPRRVQAFAEEYAGVRTATIQSAFRYDFPFSEVKKSIQFLNHKLAEGEAMIFTRSEEQAARRMILIFRAEYQKTVERIAHDINSLAAYVPRRRERKLHVGLFGYSRSVGKKQLPRAIPFTASLYAIGIPPEMIATGRGYAALSARDRELFHRLYRFFGEDIHEAGKYVNKENLALLAAKNSAWKAVQKDVALIEEMTGQRLGGTSHQEMIYRNFASNTYLLWKQHKDVSELIRTTGEIRGSLG